MDPAGIRGLCGSLLCHGALIASLVLVPRTLTERKAGPANETISAELGMDFLTPAPAEETPEIEEPTCEPQSTVSLTHEVPVTELTTVVPSDFHVLHAPGNYVEEIPESIPVPEKPGKVQRKAASGESRGAKGGGGGGKYLPPRYASTPAPLYPAAARSQKQQGTVIILARVDAGGRVSGVSLRKSSGNSSLDQSALAAVKRYKFHPAMKDGTAVPAEVEVPVRFRTG